MLPPGAPAPPFTLPDEHGRAWTLHDLRGRPFILTFYPKDETAGCIAQVCSFRNAWTDFETRGIRVFGISRDNATSHQSFIARQHLPYHLLTDANGSTHKAYDIGRRLGVTRRVTYLIDAQGTIRHAYESNLRPAAHAAKMLTAIRNLTETTTAHPR